MLLLRASSSLVPLPFLGWFSKLGIRWPATMNRGPRSSLWVAQSRALLQRGQRTECPRHRHERLPSRLRWRRYQQRWWRRRRRRRRWLVRRAALVVSDEIVGAVHGPARQPARNEKRCEHWARDRGDTRARELHRTARHGGGALVAAPGSYARIRQGTVRRCTILLAVTSTPQLAARSLASTVVSTRHNSGEIV